LLQYFAQQVLEDKLGSAFVGAVQTYAHSATVVDEEVVLRDSKMASG
jgi:hypothetical protein